MKDLSVFLAEQLSGEFEELSVLKQSARGDIHLLRHKTSRRRYICRRFTGDAAIYQKLHSISNPHLPRIYEAVQKDDTVFVLEEYIPGDTLTDILAGGALHPAEARKYMLQIADAVYALHRLDLIHRDIKPDNVIISGDNAWLIDFDASRLSTADKDRDTVILGTVGYAPPEQFGISQTDKRSDIYALGVMLNEMLTLEHPSVKLAPGRLGRIVTKCTMTAAERRYRDIRAFIFAL